MPPPVFPSFSDLRVTVFSLSLAPLNQIEERGPSLLLETSQGDTDLWCPLYAELSFLGKWIPQPSDLQEGLPQHV